MPLEATEPTIPTPTGKRIPVVASQAPIDSTVSVSLSSWTRSDRVAPSGLSWRATSSRTLAYIASGVTATPSASAVEVNASRYAARRLVSSISRALSMAIAAWSAKSRARRISSSP